MIAHQKSLALHYSIGEIDTRSCPDMCQITVSKEYNHAVVELEPKGHFIFPGPHTQIYPPAYTHLEGQGHYFLNIRYAATN